SQLRELQRAVLNRDPALDLRSAGPPLAAVERTPRPAAADSALSVQPTAPHLLPWGIADFTGREDLIAAICGFLPGPATVAPPYSVPIVVISGAGGVGKSTLAIRVAHELID